MSKNVRYDVVGGDVARGGSGVGYSIKYSDNEGEGGSSQLPNLC